MKDKTIVFGHPSLDVKTLTEVDWSVNVVRYNYWTGRINVVCQRRKGKGKKIQLLQLSTQL